MPAFDLSYPGAYIVVVTVTAVIWSLLVLGIRLFLRLKVNGPLSWDDGCCIAATILACIQSVLTLLQLRYGLGRSAGTQPQTTINWSSFLLWLSGYFYYMAQALSMLSVCFLLARIVRHRKMAWGCYGIAVATVAWALAGMATTAFECELPRPWETHDATANCIDLLDYHKGVAGDGEYSHGKWLHFLRASGAMAGSAADDHLYQSVIMLWSLNMHLAPKLQTIAAFSLRLLILPPLLIRLHFNHVSLFSNDWPRARVPAVILGQVVIHLSVILTTVPCAKPFLRIFDSGSLHLDPNFVKKLSLLTIKRKKSDGNNSQSTGESNDTFDRHAAGGGGGGMIRRVPGVANRVRKLGGGHLSPRYVLLSYPLTMESGRLSVPYVMINYLPPTCSSEMRMLYAGAKELMRNQAEVNRIIEMDAAEEIEEIEEKLKGED
ncbi:hypothetical protein KC327_g4439 [Hortaea werneckii]|nr:hypothetical protein KC358_g1215 [Hortaea werneckii]KAI6929820.1 hypothetical protein KC341_g10633 [Hortaea werneckii]KAI6947751.1 hypothetical protein KC348_g2340 [Hortaea werneckii]KAI6981658.1 hypothetical protein KC321_g1092 [Hortaea werneckii]KAI7030743.1 hypothetical protein KC366_g10142 [Hortaea werneckii]